MIQWFARHLARQQELVEKLGELQILDHYSTPIRAVKEINCEVIVTTKFMVYEFLWISPCIFQKQTFHQIISYFRLPDSASPKESVCLYSWLPLHSSTIFTFLSWFKDGTIITTYCWAGFFLLEDSRNNIVRRESLREQCIQDFIRLAPSKFDSATCNLMRCSSCLLATICPGKYRKSQSLTLRDGCHKRWCFAFKTETPS